MIEKCIAILTAYRKFCASSSSPTQLILPESYKLYPILCLAALKSAPFRLATDVTPDLRMYEMRLIRNMGVATSIPFWYPRLFSVHDLSPEVSSHSSSSLFLS